MFQSLHEEEEVLEELNLFLDLLVAYKVSQFFINYKISVSIVCQIVLKGS